MAKRTKKATPSTDVVFSMAVEAHVETPAADAAAVALLDGLLGELGGDEDIAAINADDHIEGIDDIEEIIDDEAANEGNAAIAVAAEIEGTAVDFLDDLAAEAEREAAKHALYAEQDAPTAAGDADTPTAEPKKGKGKAKAAKAPKEPKPPRATKVTHSPGDLLLAKLGGNAADFLVFNISDADLHPSELTAKTEAFIARMNDREAIADKVKEKMTMLFTWLKDGGDLNVVMARSFRLLHEQGELTSGDKGNLQVNLLAKPYSLGTARSQSNQMFMAFPELGLTVKEKGKMVPNPDSALLPLIYNRLGLA